MDNIVVEFSQPTKTKKWIHIFVSVTGENVKVPLDRVTGQLVVK